jgi:hypothetical protein
VSSRHEVLLVVSATSVRLPCGSRTRLKQPETVFCSVKKHQTESVSYQQKGGKMKDLNTFQKYFVEEFYDDY